MISVDLWTKYLNFSLCYCYVQSFYITVQSNLNGMGTPAVMTYTEKACNVTLLHDNPSYQPTTAVLSETDASNVTQLQENPSYQPITVDSAGIDDVV